MQQASYIKTVILAIFSLILVLSIISFPKQAFEASVRGLTIWWDVVFPALLPFFITSELLMGFGVVHFIGVLLEPLMRPLFRVPGVGGFVMSMGVASGYPMGAKLTVRMRESQLITRSEGERLVSITSTSGPLFMIGAVAVGFFHDVFLGIVIALAHYISAIGVGFVMRFHDLKEKPKTTDRVKKAKEQLSNKGLLYRALQAMHRARIKDGRTFGTLMGDAVHSSIQTLLVIGGFIIMFSVIINIFQIIGLNELLTFLFMIILVPLGVQPELISALVAGTFEITLGSQMASEASESNALMHKVAIASAIIAWSGLSVHAQVASMLANTDIRYKPFLFARIIHAGLAYICTLLLWNPLHDLFQATALPVFGQALGDIITIHWDRYSMFMYSIIFATMTTLCIVCIVIMAKKLTNINIR